MSISEEHARLFKRHYSPAELIADGVVHAVAIVAGVIAFAVLFVRIALHGDASDALAVSVYAGSFFLLFGFSCAYNLTPPSDLKALLRRFDHAAIYLMISGTYTAILSQLPNGALAWTLALFIWAVALAGAALEVLRPGKFERGSLFVYLGLGWTGILAANPLEAALPPQTINLIFAGGLFYTFGVPFHLWNSLKFQNAIWHCFVTIAAGCQYAGIAETIGR
jgi:hemolysin III